MNNFKGGGFKNGGLKFGGKKKSGGTQSRDSRDNRPARPAPEMFSATCTDCNKRCDVPFKPSSDKPVYCSACFGMKKSANESRGQDNNRGREDRGSHNERTDFTRPQREQRSPSYDNTRGRSDDGIADLKKQITGLELKLNRILDLINPPMPSQKESLPEKKKVVAKVSPKKVTKATPKARKVATKTVVKPASKKVVAKASVKKVAKKVVKATPKKAVKKVSKK